MSAPRFPHELWALDILDRMERVGKASGETCSISRSDLAGLTTMLIGTFHEWRDAAALNYLASLSKGRSWSVRVDGVEMGHGRVREAIYLAILKLESLNPTPSLAPSR